MEEINPINLIYVFILLVLSDSLPVIGSDWTVFFNRFIEKSSAKDSPTMDKMVCVHFAPFSSVTNGVSSIEHSCFRGSARTRPRSH